VSGSADGSASVAKDLAARLGMRYQFAPADQVGAGPHRRSRYCEPARFPRCADPEFEAVQSALQTEKANCHGFYAGESAGAIRVFNVHLDSRINKAQRLEQLAPLLKAADESGVPCLIGGDFNTSNFLFVDTRSPCRACRIRWRRCEAR